MVSSSRQLEAKLEQAPSKPGRPSSPRIYLLVATLIMVVVLLLAISALHFQSKSSGVDQGHQVLQSGDSFLYNVSGNNNGMAITPSAYNATINNLQPIQAVHVSFGTTTNVTVGYSAGWDIMAVDFYSAGEDTNIPPNLGHYFRPLWEGPHSSMLAIWQPDVNVRVLKIENEIISTNFGEKSVNVLTINDKDYNESLKVYVGQDTALVYRWSVSSFSGAYEYTYDLTYSSNTSVPSADCA